MKGQKDDIKGKIKVLKRSYTQDHNLDIENLKEFFSIFRIAYDNATSNEKRELIRTFIRHIDLHPESEEIKLEFYHDQIVQSIGLGEHNHMQRQFFSLRTFQIRKRSRTAPLLRYSMVPRPQPADKRVEKPRTAA